MTTACRSERCPGDAGAGAGRRPQGGEAGAAYLHRCRCLPGEAGDLTRWAKRHALVVTVGWPTSGWTCPMIRAFGLEVVDGVGFDAADDWIAERVGRGDIVISDDIPLAARCIAKGARVLTSRGAIYDEQSIGSAPGPARPGCAVPARGRRGLGRPASDPGQGPCTLYMQELDRSGPCRAQARLSREGGLLRPGERAQQQAAWRLVADVGFGGIPRATCANRGRDPRPAASCCRWVAADHIAGEVGRSCPRPRRCTCRRSCC